MILVRHQLDSSPRLVPLLSCDACHTNFLIWQAEVRGGKIAQSTAGSHAKVLSLTCQIYICCHKWQDTIIFVLSWNNRLMSSAVLCWHCTAGLCTPDIDNLKNSLILSPHCAERNTKALAPLSNCNWICQTSLRWHRHFQIDDWDNDRLCIKVRGSPKVSTVNWDIQ